MSRRFPDLSKRPSRNGCTAGRQPLFSAGFDRSNCAPIPAISERACCKLTPGFSRATTVSMRAVAECGS